MSKMPEISVKDITGVVAYMPTTTRRDIVFDRNTKNAVDLGEAGRAADVLVRDGASAIVLNGTFGELAGLTLEEITDFTKAVVDSVAGRVPVFAGATTLNTRDTMTRGRIFRDLGVTGLNMGRPMLSAMDDTAILQWYQDIAAEFPDMAIFLYDDAQAFKRPINTSVYVELAKIPQIVACKYRTQLMISNLVGSNTYNDDLRAVNGKIKLLTQEVDWPLVNKAFGTDSCWSSYINCAPGYVMAIRDAIYAGDTAKVDALIAEGHWPGSNYSPSTSDSWHMNKVTALKTRIQYAGYINAGPPLPPYHVAPEERFETAKAFGLKDREVQKKYPHKTMLEAAVPAE